MVVGLCPSPEHRALFLNRIVFTSKTILATEVYVGIDTFLSVLVLKNMALHPSGIIVCRVVRELSPHARFLGGLHKSSLYGLLDVVARI